MEMHAPWSLKAKYTPFLVTFTAFVSVLITTSLLALNLPSPAAIRPIDKKKKKNDNDKCITSIE